MTIVAADELRSLFDAILAAPDDDAPRSKLAQYLIERGDRRGEHVRLSCELEQLEPDDPARAALVERCAKLPSFAFFTNTQRNFPYSFVKRRGFVEEFECGVRHFVAHADELMRDAPIRVYDPNPVHGQGAALANCPALAKLRCLKLGHVTAVDDRAAILASPYLVGLRELELTPWLLDASSVAKLGWQLRRLRGLRVLTMHYGTIEGSACMALGLLAKVLRLELLHIAGTRMPDSGLVKLRSILGTDRVLPRPEPSMTFRFGVLDLSKSSAMAIRALIDSGKHRSATKLVFKNNRIGDDVIAHVARSGAFPALVELDLDGTGITDDGARVLAREAVGLEQLAAIDLGEVPGGVGDAAIEELARSPRLPSLRTIVRGWEHRPYTEHAREEKEVVSIRRADGRVVESIIHHWIFP